MFALRLASVLFLLGVACARAQTLPKLELPEPREPAERALVDAYRKAEAEHGTDSPKLIPPMNALGNHYQPRAVIPAVTALRRRELAIHEIAFGNASVQALRSRLALAAHYGAIEQDELAREVLGTALEDAERIAGPDSVLAADALRTRAVTRSRITDMAGRAEDLRRAQAIFEKRLGAGHRETARTGFYLARDLARLGQRAAALQLLERARPILAKELGPAHPMVGDLDLETAGVLRNLGQLDRAEALLRAVLDVPRAMPHDAASMRFRATFLLGAIASNRDEPAKARELYLEAARHAQSLAPPSPLNVATSLSAAGSAFVKSDMRAEGQRYLERADSMLRTIRAEGSPGFAANLLTLGWLRMTDADLDGAARHYHEAHDIALRQQDPLLRNHTNRAHSMLAVQRGDRPSAIYFLKAAVNDLQSIRGSLAGRGQSERELFIGRHVTVYRQLAELLVEEGRILESQEALRLLKQDEYREFIGGEGAEVERMDFVGAEARLRARHEELARELASLARERTELQRRARLGLGDEGRGRLSAVEERLAQLREALAGHLGDVPRSLAAPAGSRRESSERHLERLEALRRTLGELGDGVALLHYLVAERRVSVIVTTAAAQVARDSPIDSARLNQLVRDFRTALQDRGDAALSSSKALHDVLVGPVAGDLERARARVLMLSLDGVLRYVPFAALHDGERYLVERYRTAIYTEAASERLRDRPAPAWRIAGLGVTRGTSGFEALPAVRAELEGIRGHVVPGEVWLDDDFTVDRLRGALDQGFPLVHIASHFHFRPGTEADSFLLIGDGSRLSLKALRERKFDFGRVDLITLSACDTAVGGGRDESGREVEGFGALVQNLGAKGVVATLWPVADLSTAQFMRELYRARQAAPATSKADALREVQLRFIRDPRWRHPFFWAPFVLMGNWL